LHSPRQGRSAESSVGNCYNNCCQKSCCCSRNKTVITVFKRSFCARFSGACCKYLFVSFGNLIGFRVTQAITAVSQSQSNCLAKDNEFHCYIEVKVNCTVYCKTRTFREHQIFAIWVESRNYIDANFWNCPSP